VSNTWLRFAAAGFELSITNDFTLLGNRTRVDLGGESS